MKINYIGVMMFLTGSFYCTAQNLDIGFGVGTGSAYIIENNDNTINVDYSLPFSSYVDLKYSKPENYFGVKLRFQYMNVEITGNNWKTTTNDILDGQVSSFTTMIILEHLNDTKTWNLGYNFGFGYTKQYMDKDFSREFPTIEDEYMSINISGIISRQISKKLSIQIQPTLLWTDPVGSFRKSENWQIANEDITGLLQLGMAYRFN